MRKIFIAAERNALEKHWVILGPFSNFKNAYQALTDGGYVVTYQSDWNQDGDDSGIFAQRYNTAGETVGQLFRVNTTTDNAQRGPWAVASATTPSSSAATTSSTASTATRFRSCC